MIKRVRKVTFRLTSAEEERFSPMLQQLGCWTWSDLCRRALEHFADKTAPAASDNFVGQLAEQSARGVGGDKAKKKKGGAKKTAKKSKGNKSI